MVKIVPCFLLAFSFYVEPLLILINLLTRGDKNYTSRITWSVRVLFINAWPEAFEILRYRLLALLPIFLDDRP